MMLWMLVICTSTVTYSTVVLTRTRSCASRRDEAKQAFAGRTVIDMAVMWSGDGPRRSMFLQVILERTNPLTVTVVLVWVVACCDALPMSKRARTAPSSSPPQACSNAAH